MIAALLVLALQASDTILPATFRPAWSRGDDADTLVSFVRLIPNYVSIGPDGHVFILDRERSRVVELDANGRTLRGIGRSGHGPAELTSPTSIAVSPGGFLLVYDFARQGFARWSPQRRPLPLLPVPNRAIPNFPRALTDTSVLFSSYGLDSVRLLHLSGSSLRTVAAAPLAAAKTVGKEICGLTVYEREPVFSPTLVWAAWGDSPVTAFGPRPEIHGPTGGTSPQSWAAPRAPTPATRQMAIEELGESRVVIPRQPECRYPASRIVDAVGQAAFLPAYQRLIPASPDTLWAIRFAVRGHPVSADLFSRLRGYLGTVTLGERQPVAFFPDGRLLSLEATADDVPLLVAYQVQVGRR